MENIKIENKNQSDITKELKNDFKNYEKRNKGYHEELYDLGTKHLETYKNKIENAKQKLESSSRIDEKLNERFNKAKDAIEEKTKKLKTKDYLFHHNENLNALGAEIDNYENDAIDTINDLISVINNEQEIQGEKNNIDNINKAKEYIKINEDGTYTLTQYTNKPKIHEVLKSVIKEGELWKIDYSECKNNSIKTKMINAISNNDKYENTQQSSSCYLRYDQNQKTYVLSDGSGNILQQRALIREGVKLTPPSKIKGDAKATIEQNKQTQIDKINNIQLNDEEQKELFESMPKKMREKLSQQDINNFFEVTEKSMNERIIEAKKEGYSLNTNKPISKYGGKGFLMKLNLINENAETSKPLIENKFDKNVRDAFSKGKLKKYLTSRIRQKRNDFDYLTKRGTVLDQNTDREGNSENLLDTDKKDFLLEGLSMLGKWAEAVSEKIGNTHLKDDDREFVAIINFIKDAENDINSQNITNNDLATIESKLTQMLSRFFKNNFIRSSLQINKNDIEGYVKDILSSGDKEKSIIAMRKMGASRTRFDNSQTAFLRDDIFEQFGRKEKRDENGEIMKDEEGNIIYKEGVVDLEDDNFEKYFEKINELYQLDPEKDIGEDGEIKEPKKTSIDNLYKAARENTGKHGVKNFKKRLVDQGLLPKRRGHGGQIDDKIRTLKTQLEQQEKNANKFKITGSDIRERTKQQLAEMQATLTSSQIQAAEQGDNGMNDQGIATLNALNFMLQQDDSFFNKLADDETKSTQKSIKYCGIDSVVRGNLAPYLIRRGGGINSDNEIAKIYNDSVGAGGWFDFSDEGAERIGPLLKEIVVEVVVTAVSILLSRNGAGEAIYAAFRTAKLAAQTMKGFKKFREFMKIFTKNIIKNSLSIGAGKLKVGSIKMGKHAIGGAKTAAEIIKTTETLSKWGKFAIKGTSLIIEGTHFHINSTIIHNIINGEDFWEGLNPLGYTEGPDGEKISNLKSYAQSIAFLGVLKGTGKIMGKLTGKSLQNLTGKEIQNITKGRYGPAMANKIFSTSLSLGSEMGSMMGTDQILSLVFDQSLKPVTGEELISMFGMIVGLRLNGKFQMKIKEYTGQKTTIRMTQEGTGNIFDIRMDGEGNVLKVEGTDKNGKKIQNPQDVLGIKQGDLGQNLRETHAGKEVGTVKGGIKELNNLHEGDVITVRHGENDVKFKKNKNGNWEIIDAGNIKNERFEAGEEYIPKENSDGSGYHLETKSGGGPKITLDGRVGVKLGGRESHGSEISKESNKSNLENTSSNTGPTTKEQNIINNKIIERATEQLHEKFDQEIMSKNGITIDGITYKLEWRPNEGHNPNRKGRIVYTETGQDGKVRIKVEANSDTFVLPENSNGNNIRERYNIARKNYVERNLNSTLESARNDLDGEFSRDIDLKSKDLEGRRKGRAVLEGKKKNLSDEVDGLKSRKAQLEQQLQNISKELTIQPDISSLKDIYSIIREGNKITIGGKKYIFIGVKGDKIVFTEGKGKTKEFSSFKEMQDAKANFNFDIKNRQSERGLEQQIMFEELVGKEARTKNANEIIREYESLQRQKTQIEQDIRDGFFRENAIKLKGKHIWIDGIEYQCTDIKTNNGRTTLDFKKTDGSDSFTISSFEQLKAKGQVNGFGDRYDVIDKETKAAGRELSRYERENHELLRGENGLFKGENKYVENKRQELGQINRQLENGKYDYNNAVQANRPRTVPNPEYERIQKEIEGIDAQLIEKGQQLTSIERDLGASDTEITRLEHEINDLTNEKNNLNRNNGGNEIEKQREQQEKLQSEEQERLQKEEQEKLQREQQERLQREQQERLQREQQERLQSEEKKSTEGSKKTFGEYNHEFANIIKNNQERIINLEKIENMDSFMNESFKFLKEEMGIDDPNLKIKIIDEITNNHYDRTTNTIFFSRNWGGIGKYVEGGIKAETFGGIGHELNHYLQDVEIIKHYGKGNANIDLFVENILEKANTEGLKMIEKYIAQIDHNEPISERAIKYAESYIKAAKDGSIFDENGNILDYNKYRKLRYEKESFDRGDILADEYKKATKSYKEQQRRQREEEQRRQREEEQRRQREEEEQQQDTDIKVLYTEIQKSELNMLKNLNRGRNEQIYLDEFGEPKNVISLGNGENLYVSNCLQSGSRKFIVGYVQKGGEMRLRLFYRSNSEGARRSCPGKRALKISPDGEIIGGGGFSKGENIPNSSYETTTRVINELQYKFDSLPQEKTRYNPIDFNRVGPNILEPEMASTIKIDKLFNGPKNDTVNYIAGRTSAEVKDMYRRLGENVDMSEMKMVEGKGYTYEHQYLGTIEVQICRLNYNGKNLDFSFAKVKNDPENRVRIEGVNYADAKITSFGIYDKQINAAPLTGKPIDYATYNSRQVPKDRQGKRYGENYMDIRDLYQENPFVKKFKEISQQQFMMAA